MYAASSLVKAARRCILRQSIALSSFIPPPRQQCSRLFSVYAWGNADDGRLGLPSSLLDEEISGAYGSTLMTPTPIPALENVEILNIAVGAAHTVFLTKDGYVLTCGLGSHGQLGHGDLHSVEEPCVVQGLGGMNGGGGRATAIAAGDLHTLVVMDSGEVYAFGSNEHGQLGCGSDFEEMCVRSPVIIRSLIGDGIAVKDVAAGGGFSVFKSVGGSVYTGGWNAGGRLGHGGGHGWWWGWEGDGKGIPRVVRGLKGLRVDGIYAGGSGRCFAKGEGRVWGWGSGSDFGLGSGDGTDRGLPVEVVGLRGRGVQKVAVGSGHALALDEWGGVWVWGGNDHGCLGIGEGRAWRGNVTLPERLDTVSGVADVAAGWHVSACVVGRRSSEGMVKGKVMTWGCGQAGALGLEKSMMDYWEPTELIGVSAGRIACGVKQMFAF